MAGDPKGRLLDLLERQAFAPVLRAKASDYPEAKRASLADVQEATRAEMERFRGCASAQEVVHAFHCDLHSDLGKARHRQLNGLGLPTLADLRDSFEKLASDLRVGS
jgi:hypothetical protein